MRGKDQVRDAHRSKSKGIRAGRGMAKNQNKSYMKGLSTVTDDYATVEYDYYEITCLLSAPTFAPTTKGATNKPTFKPTMTTKPSVYPTTNPASVSAKPTVKKSVSPTKVPTLSPSTKPSGKPSSKPSAKPSTRPTVKPSSMPSASPTTNPAQISAFPTGMKSMAPTARPTLLPTSGPTRSPVSLPTWQPTIHSSTPQPTSSPVSLDVDQIINKCGYDSYLQNTTAYVLTITNAVVASVKGITLSDITDFVMYPPADTLTLSQLSFIQIMTSSSLSSDPSTSTTLSFSYTIISTNSAVTANGLSSELTTSINNGDFDSFLSYFAKIFGATGLEAGADAGTFSTSSSSSSNNSSLNGGIIAIIVLVVVLVVAVTVGVCYSTGLAKHIVNPPPESNVPRASLSVNRQTETRGSLKYAPKVSDVENPLQDRHTATGGQFGTVLSMDTRPSSLPIVPPEPESSQEIAMTPLTKSEPVATAQAAPVPVPEPEPVVPSPPPAAVVAEPEPVRPPSVTNPMAPPAEIKPSAPSEDAVATATLASPSNLSRPTSTSSVSEEQVAYERAVEEASAATYSRMGGDERLQMETNPMAALKRKKQQQQQAQKK